MLFVEIYRVCHQRWQVTGVGKVAGEEGGEAFPAGVVGAEEVIASSLARAALAVENPAWNPTGKCFVFLKKI